jgi:PAS domain S-box-containing protein
LSEQANHRYLPVTETSSSLSADETKFQTLLESAPDAVVVVDRDGRIVLVNTQTERLFGYARDELLGQIVDILLPHRMWAGHVRHRQAYTSDPRIRPMGQQQLDLIALRKDGTEFPAEISLAPLETPDGLLVTSMIRDITERKRAEEARAQLASEHAARVHAETEVRAREEFLSIAAHELKTPLTSVKASAQFLDRLLHTPATSPDHLLRLSGQLNSQVDRLEALVADLLDVSRIQLGRLTMRPESVDLVELARQIVKRFESSPELTHKHSLVIDGPVRLAGTWDGQRLDQVLTNLVSNALKYSPDGGDVRIIIRQEGNDAVLRVQDAGIGIAAADQANLFEPFTRGTTLNGSVSGSGLGLYISHQIIEGHGGEMWIESTPGQGSIFGLRLPLAGAAVAPDATAIS